MGYTTEFYGSFILSKKPTPEQIDYFDRFGKSRRVMRDVAKLKELYAGEYGLNGEYGKQGEYFVPCRHHPKDGSIIKDDDPPASQPHTYHCWILADNGAKLQWDGGEKFYYYVEWLEYLIKHFFIRWDIQLNGQVEWYGEDEEDCGMIIVVDNVVTTTTIL